MNLLIASVDTLPRIGGISLMTHALANALVALGHGVVVLGPAGTAIPREYIHHYGLIEDVESRPERGAGRAALVEDDRIRKLFEAVIDRRAIDRVLLMHPFYYALGALDACRARSIRCSVYFHGLELRAHLRDGSPENQAELHERCSLRGVRERLFFTIGRCDEILVNSSYTASLLDGFQSKPCVRVTGCGIAGHDLERERSLSPEYSAEKRAERRGRFGLGRGPCLGYVGRLVRPKRVERLLGICRAAPELSALIVGTGSKEVPLRGCASSWGLDSRVKFLGQVPESEKWAALRAMDFACLLSEPSTSGGSVEGFGIALLEAAAAAAVPVSSGTGGMVDVVRHHSTGVILPPWDPDAAQVLLGLCEDEATMKGLSSAARAQVAERYTWEAVARRILVAWGD